uniref:Uncharacterized protein n=1 Tax=Anopheles darlingi TaxID=43151 RepID=A0A2M4D952_ANODA
MSCPSLLLPVLPPSFLFSLSSLSFWHTHTRIVANFYAYDAVGQDILPFLSLSLSLSLFPMLFWSHQ